MSRLIDFARDTFRSIGAKARFMQSKMSARRAVVYTAIFGGYDSLKEQPPQDTPCDFVCFTDDVELGAHSATWRVVRLRPKRFRTPTSALDHPRMQAKWFKLMSHRVFPGGRLALRYDFSPFARRRYSTIIWIDGSIQIKTEAFVRELSGYLGLSGWALVPHPERDCIYDELVAAAPMAKYTGQPLEEQVAHYRAMGHPPHGGLWACGVIVRKGKSNQRLDTLNEAWWDENRHWSYQDQLSLPYLLRRFGMSVDRIPCNLWRNEWFNWVPHNSET
jgi:TOD1/MUCI70, glycosyltransferase-like domain